MILGAMFTVMEKSLYLIREMNDLAGYVLLHRVLESSPSRLGFHTVKVTFIDWYLMTISPDRFMILLKIHGVVVYATVNIVILYASH